MWYALAGAQDTPREWLKRTPFNSYTAPGLILGVAVGGSDLAAACAIWRRSPDAATVSSLAALILLGWIATQVAMIGYRSFLQPL